MPRLDDTSEQNILNMLLDHSLIDSKQLRQIKTMSKEVGKSKLETAFELNFTDEKKILKLLSSSYSLPIVDLKPYKLNEQLKKIVPINYIIDNSLVPFEMIDGTLKIAIPDASKLSLMNNLKTITKMDPELYAASISDINDFIQRITGGRESRLELEEIKLEQLKKKEYNYQCKVEPLNSHCNRSLCRTRKFGISHHQAFPAIGGMTVVQSEPPVWFVDVDGARLELGTKQLQMQIDFQRACMEQMYKMPARMKESEWRDLIDSLMDNATRITVPEELTRKGQFSELLEIFCTGRLQAHTPEELLTGKPWTEEKFTYFKLGSLQEFLKGHGFNHYTRGQITERLKEMNNGGQADKQFRFKDNKDAWRKIRVWFVPEIYRGDVDFPPVTFEKDDDDVPF